MPNNTTHSQLENGIIKYLIWIQDETKLCQAKKKSNEIDNVFNSEEEEGDYGKHEDATKHEGEADKIKLKF